MGLTRSEQMSRIRGRNTSPERLLRGRLWKLGHRYRLHSRTEVGSPDIVFVRKRVAVFIDGCFWHGCPEHYVRPRSSSDFWARKLRENVDRDRRQTIELERLGWRVVRVWEHQVFEALDSAAAIVIAALTQPRWSAPASWRVVGVELLDETTDLERRHLEDFTGRRAGRVVDQKRSTRKWKNRI
jgi:DNA mismatch endonuclease (patch repair protein)